MTLRKPASHPKSDIPHPTSLRDAHVHLAAHGQAMSMERFDSCTGPDDFLNRLGRAARGGPRSEWLLGGGVRVEGWADPRWPSLKQLDAATDDRPLCVWSFDHHALVVNSAAMWALSVPTDGPDPENGVIVRDKKGQPTGLMLEAAAKLVWSSLPVPNAETRKRFVVAALKDLARHGFTEVHDLLSPPWLGPLLGELEREGKLSMRVSLFPALADLDEVVRKRSQWEGERLKLAGAKLFADGTLNSRTAWMLEPYAEPLPGLPTGQAMLTREELAAAMTRVWAQDLALAVHAIGDGAVRAVLDAYEAARGATPGATARPAKPSAAVPKKPRTVAPQSGPAVAPAPVQRPRLRIEHAEIIDKADVPRFARLGVVASVQPCHLLTDIDVLRRQLPHRLARVLPLRELIDSGCKPGELLWFGSDTPIVRPHPEDSIQAATQRRRPGAPAADAIAPTQAITETEAKAAFRPCPAQSPL